MKDKKWAERHGIIGAVGYHSGLRGKELRRYWRHSKRSFGAFMRMLKGTFRQWRGF